MMETLLLHLNDLYRVAMWLAAGDGASAERMVTSAYDDVSHETTRRQLFRALIRAGRQTIHAPEDFPLAWREAIVLVDGMDFSYSEACAVLDIERESLAFRLERAREQIRRLEAYTSRRGFPLFGSGAGHAPFGDSSHSCARE